MALKLAKFAVNTTPSEFLTWAKLTDGMFSKGIYRLMMKTDTCTLVYIDIGDYQSVRFWDAKRMHDMADTY